jgi:predicted PurR-regulated permease PerM
MATLRTSIPCPHGHGPGWRPPGASAARSNAVRSHETVFRVPGDSGRRAPVIPQDKRYTFDRVVRMVLSAVTIAIVILLLRYLSDVLLPFAAAVVLAYLLNPLVNLFATRTKRRGLAVLITIGGLALLGMAVTFVAIALVSWQAEQFGRQIDTLRADLLAAIRITTQPVESSPVPQAVPPFAPVDAVSGEDGLAASATAEPAAAEAAPAEKSDSGLAELVEGWEILRAGEGTRSQRIAAFRRHIEGTGAGYVVQQLADYVQSEDFKNLALTTAKRVVSGGWTVGTFLLNLALGAVGLIIIFIYLVFLLLDYPEYARRWKSFLPPAYSDNIVEFLEEFDIAMRRYFRGQALVAMLTGVLFCVGFTIIGLPMAIPLGLLLGVLNMVPYLQAVGLVPAAVLALMKSLEGGHSLAWTLLSIAIVFLVVQIIQDTLITPRVMGKATGLRPVAILLGVFVWGKLLGFLGLLLAIPLTCLGIAYYRRLVLRQSREESQISPT